MVSGLCVSPRLHMFTVSVLKCDFFWGLIFSSATFVNSLTIVDRLCGVFRLDNCVYLWRGTILFPPFQSSCLTSSCLTEWPGPRASAERQWWEWTSCLCLISESGTQVSVVTSGASSGVSWIFVTTVKQLPSVPGLLRVSVTHECWVLSDGLHVSWCGHVVSGFSCRPWTRWIAPTDFWVLTQTRVPGVNPTWLECVTLCALLDQIC